MGTAGSSVDITAWASAAAAAVAAGGSGSWDDEGAEGLQAEGVTQDLAGAAEMLQRLQRRVGEGRGASAAAQARQQQQQQQRVAGVGSSLLIPKVRWTAAACAGLLPVHLWLPVRPSICVLQQPTAGINLPTPASTNTST